MKKERQSSKQGPIQLSANKKSHSINLKSKQQPLFVPYKIDWKHPIGENPLFSNNQSVPLKQPFKNIENSNLNSQYGNGVNSNTNSKLFYKNMKSELLNIKQDVQKLILKEKKTSITSVDHMITNCDDRPLTEHQNNNGCMKTISIKNKCQQKARKIQSVYENVDKFLSSKISQNDMGSSKFTAGETRCERSSMNHFIENQLKNSSSNETKYRSQKDSSCMRTKSKSIAQCFTKNFALDLLHAREEKRDSQLRIDSSLKFLQSEQNPNLEEPLPEMAKKEEPVKQKMEVEIKLPSFDKQKNDQNQEEKNKLIEKLQNELKDLEKELSLRDELMSRKQQNKFQLAEEVQKMKKELQQEKQSNQETLKKYEEEIFNLRNINRQNENRAKFYEDQLQKAIHVIRQKEQQAVAMMENMNSQVATIQELSAACEKLRIYNKEMKQSVEESRNIKEKMKLKENQLYIYQEELKEAKRKIKELKEFLSSSIPTKTSDNSFKSIEDQENALEESSKLSWELKECRRLNSNLKSQNQRLKKELHQINSTNSENHSKITHVIKENSELKAKILEFEKDSQKAIQDLVNNVNFQGLGNQISKKLSFLSEENYQLKNKINRLEASFEELTLKNCSLTQELKIHEQKASLSKDCTRRLKIEDWDSLTEQRDFLKSELQVVKNRLEEIKEFYELQTMRKENEIHELKQQIEQMIDIEVQNEESFHLNVRSVKHIKNLDTLLSEFKGMIEQNLQIKQQLESMKK